MTELGIGVSHGAEVVTEPPVDAVRRAALDLLGALPERPQRLRLRVADVVVDLDWRTPPDRAAASGPSMAVAAVHAEQTVLPVVEPLVAVPAPPADEHYVCAPSIGTFYRAPEPGAAPFVTEGDEVRPGQQVGIVEAMKLMMPVEADRPGQVVAVLAKDGQAVDYGERLLALAPAGPE
ncbi:acetyl-CoA carboxylase biotin carboxyl carrier protein [Dactylosporangium sp. CA-139066]|uniref:acetyl-CoA carboxylase biotin carboxyl carrier protein n=1 Tax=Dactylosporangium sp. CA-139066 TaxID=3239930 RepID=UPI003D90C6F1